jgi:hypothetical protein
MVSIRNEIQQQADRQSRSEAGRQEETKESACGSGEEQAEQQHKAGRSV